MRSLLVSFLLIVSSATVTLAQQRLDPSNQISQMEKLHFMAGEWSGSGWMMMGPGQKSEFASSEKVSIRLDGVALLVEGRHTSEDESGEISVVHDALAMISYDEAAGNYSFRSQLASGRGGNFTGVVNEDGAFVWGMNPPNGYQIRYTIGLDESGRWHEVGEMSQDAENWRQFFEMTLSKVDE